MAFKTCEACLRAACGGGRVRIRVARHSVAKAAEDVEWSAVCVCCVLSVPLFVLPCLVVQPTHRKDRWGGPTWGEGWSNRPIEKIGGVDQLGGRVGPTDPSQYVQMPKGTPKNNSQIWPNPPLKSSADRIFRHRPSISARSRLRSSRFDLGAPRPPAAPSGRPPLPPPSPSANARPALPRPSDAPPPSPEPPRHACAPRRRPERPSGPLRPASAPSAAATRVHRSRAAVMTGTPHGPTAPTRVATAVRSRVAPTARPRFDPLRLTAPHNLLW